MLFSLEMTTPSAAFVGDEGDLEVARILRFISDVVTHKKGIMGGGVSDPDGNPIGDWRYRRDPPQAAPLED